MPEITLLLTLALAIRGVIAADDDAWAERAREGGLNPQGPTDAHGERIYSLEAPLGLPVSFQSKVE